MKNGYVICKKCGRLFSSSHSLEHHQKTTLICREIVSEKSLAITTNSVERLLDNEVASRRHKNANLLLLKQHRDVFNELLCKFEKVNLHKYDLQKERMKKKKEDDITFAEINH